MNQGKPIFAFLVPSTDFFQGDRQKGSTALNIILQRNVVVLVVFVDILCLIDGYFCTKQRSLNSFSSNRCISVSVKAFQREVTVWITTCVGEKTKCCKLMNRSFSLSKTHWHLSFFSKHHHRGILLSIPWQYNVNVCKDVFRLKSTQNYTRPFSESQISQTFHFKMLGKRIDNIMRL